MKDVFPVSKPPNDLTPLQNLIVDTYFEHDCNVNQTAIALNRDPANVKIVLNSIKVRKETALRSKHLMKQAVGKARFDVSKEDRVQLLWKIAQEGVEKTYDKEGNQVMASPATSVSAVRAINEMLPGSLAPKEVELTIQNDTRSEEEIRNNIAKLTKEYNSLVAIEGVTEQDVNNIRKKILEDANVLDMMILTR